MGRSVLDYAGERIGLMVAYHFFPHPKFLDAIARLDEEHVREHEGCVLRYANATQAVTPESAPEDATVHLVSIATQQPGGVRCWICGGPKDGHGH